MTPLTCYSTAELKTALMLDKTSLATRRRIHGSAEFELVEMPVTRGELEAELAKRTPDPARMGAFLGWVMDEMD
jgi:hypothetical protein